MTSALSNTFLDEMRAIVGHRFTLTEPEVMATYECDACVLVKARPGAVVLPATAQQVADIVKACVAHHVTYVARGAGTGLSGGALALESGLIIGLNRLNKILRLDPRLHIATVEVGVVNAWLSHACDGMGLFYAPDPSSQMACTIGGNIAENAGGIHCLKYGVTVNHVLGLQWVSPEGELVTVGGAHRRGHGLNLTGLLVGSEGTLGIITAATVRLMIKPTQVCVFLAAFEKTEQATRAVSAIITSGLGPSALEFMDAATVRAVNEAFDVGFPTDCQAVLLIELDGSQAAIHYGQQKLEDLLHLFDCQQIRIATDPQERYKLWAARKGAVAAYGRIAPAFYLHDCVIPRSRLTEVLQQIVVIGETYQVPIASVFHAGDGNLHPHIFYDPDKPEQMEPVLKAGDAIIRLCLEVGGTLSGEHGIGLEKAAYMDRVFTSEDLAWMQQLKQQIDPDGLANPGKIFPSRRACGEVQPGLKMHPLLQSGELWV